MEVHPHHLLAFFVFAGMVGDIKQHLPQINNMQQKLE
jgi:hypothetical protein